MTKKQFKGYKLNKYKKVYFDSIEEAEEAYDECIAFVIAHPRWALDNLYDIKEFYVPWLNYASKEYCEEHGRRYCISAPRNK